MAYSDLRIKSSEVTSQAVWQSRRAILRNSGVVSAALATNTLALSDSWLSEKGYIQHETDLSSEITPKGLVTTYNNFYEFGLDKGDPSKNAHVMKTDPWTIKVSGAVKTPGTIDLETVLKEIDIEERIYRLRCVEAWSAVVPWLGFPVKKLLDKFEPLGSAKYVAFETLLDRDIMPGTRSFFSSIDYPYVEGLRLDEAYHDLAIFAIGMYGEVMPNQNGAPFRLVVPWKYGFKSIKSIVEIRLTEEQPPTTWNEAQPREYGFYSNVNPEKDHPRWSQKEETRLGSGLFADKIPTLMFNGYPEVADLYSGMNLMRNF